MAPTPKSVIEQVVVITGASSAAERLGWRALRQRDAALFSAHGGLLARVPLAIDRFLAETHQVAKRKTPDAAPAIRNLALISVAG
jgi:hypothetical protein